MPPCIPAFFALLLCSLPLAGQDLHFSQFYHHPMQLNPASTGIFKGNLRAAGLYRAQWQSVPVNYQTFAAAVDWKALRRDKDLLAVGFSLANDQAGDAGLSWTQVGATASVAHALGASQAISAGFGISVAQRAFDISGLTFKNQWAGDVFDPSRPTKEPFGARGNFFPSLSAGLNWHFERPESRTRLDIGAGATHLNRPVVSLGDFEGERLPLRVTFCANASLQMQKLLDAVFFAAAQEMARSREIIFGGGIRRVLTTGIANETAVQATLALRIGDALVPAVQVERNAWTIGLSYDWNISEFEVATGGRGGIEIAAVYRLVPVPPLKTVRACPIF
jgi:type IX secretion system PorP/SprF family membrane protein